MSGDFPCESEPLGRFNTYKYIQVFKRGEMLTIWEHLCLDLCACDLLIFDAALCSFESNFSMVVLYVKSKNKLKILFRSVSSPMSKS